MWRVAPEGPLTLTLSPQSGERGCSLRLLTNTLPYCEQRDYRTRPPYAPVVISITSIDPPKEANASIAVR